MYTVADFGINPLMFYYEITQACDLVCKHCRASAQENPAKDELPTSQSFALLDQIATFPRTPTVVFTGGDPLKRPDLFTLIEYAVSLGLQTALTPSATPLATQAALEKAKTAGIGAFGISLDGPDAKTHDAFRGFEGSFEKTLEMLENARSLGVPVQVNTSITKRNYRKIDAIADLLGTQGIKMWSLFFLVPVGRGVEEERILPEEYLQVFEQLWKHSQVQPYAIKTTEAPHYRRFVLEKGGNPLAGPQTPDTIRELRHRAPLGITDGRGIMFVSHNGEIFPAGFLPIVCGRFPNDSVVDVYQKHPLFKSLQDPNRYKGICGKCNSRQICGGSRARAYAITGDPLGAEPDCLLETGLLGARPDIPVS
ncbi:MAG: TIGR04053 family radical SAM/SPASM domain-containing protein [Planctomycetaceae bacterium]|nr:TIGR04053 family radical SAM/SPASM domain-containing protein [Planctomycetaceae bacterium]